MTSFWLWLVKGSGERSGLGRFLDRWLLVHATVGLAFALVLPVSLEEAATKLLLPVAGILVGLSLAWGGNASALLQSVEVEAVAQYREGGFAEYVYTFQAAILLILVTVVVWAVAGLGIFDKVWPACTNSWEYKIIVAVLFLLSSLTLRECWHVVLAVQSLLLMRFEIRRRRKNHH